MRGKVKANSKVNGSSSIVDALSETLDSSAHSYSSAQLRTVLCTIEYESACSFLHNLVQELRVVHTPCFWLAVSCSKIICDLYMLGHLI